MLLLELRKQGKLAAKRHPMFEKNRFGKFFAYCMSVFMMGYLAFFGVLFAFGFDGLSVEPYHVLNKGLLAVVILDFLMRFMFQKTPTQEVKPYLLLPVSKNRVLDFLLIRSGFSGYNFIWLFMYAPFALLTVVKFYGFWGMFTYCLGIYLVMLVNNYWFLFCRTLLNQRVWWILLPILVYAGLIVAEFTLDHPISNFTVELGDWFIQGNILSFLGVIVMIIIAWLSNRAIMSGLIYQELNRVDDTRVKRVSEYKFLDRYGEVGEYFRLELKLLLRNKRSKANLRSMAIVIVMFVALISFTDFYDSLIMSNFIFIYVFVSIGTVMLSQIMAYEGSYIDGLLTRKESILNLLKAKYYLYSAMVLVPIIALIPAMIVGKLTLLNCLSLAFLTTGPVYFGLFQMAVYNNKTVPLNEGLTGRQASGTGLQSIISLATFTLPIILVVGFKNIFGETTGQIVILIIGLLFTLTSPLWIRNIYKRFMARRYENMEGYRDTK